MEKINEFNLLKYDIENIFKNNKKFLNFDENEKKELSKCKTINQLKKFRKNLKEYLKFKLYVDNLEEVEIIKEDDKKPEIIKQDEYKPVIIKQDEYKPEIIKQDDYKPEMIKEYITELNNDVNDKVKLFNQEKQINDLKYKIQNYKKIIKQLTNDNKRLKDIFNNTTDSNTTEEDDEDIKIYKYSEVPKLSNNKKNKILIEYGYNLEHLNNLSNHEKKQLINQSQSNKFKRLFK